MINRKLFKSAVIITAIMLSLTACGKKDVPVSAEATVSEEESTEESLESSEPAPSPTVTPTAEPEEESLDNTESEVDTAEEQEEDLGYEIIYIDDTIMYATTNCNLRQTPSTELPPVGSLSYAQQITVNGKVETEDGKLWWVLKSDTEEKQMVSGGLVSETKPVQQSSSGNSGNGSSSQPSGGNGSSGNGGGTTQQPSGGNSGGGSQPPADDEWDPGSLGFGEDSGPSGDYSGMGPAWTVE